MKLENIVTSLEMSEQLKKAGFYKKTMFSYFKNKDGDIYLGETDFDKNEFLNFAYTFSELMFYIPANFDVDTNVFVAKPTKYEKITEAELSDFQVAQFEFLKIEHNVNTYFYMSKYCLGHGVIAFGQNTKGEYRNLMRFGETEVESIAKMIMALIEEDKITL